jgi:hypothetical protein
MKEEKKVAKGGIWNLVGFMVVLRVITPDLFLLLKDKRPFEFLDTKLNSPFLALGKHIQRFPQIESSSAKKSELPSAIPSIQKPN